ncbi:hypothetical protein [Alienimonas chondri]|uniref:DUF2066 domain-containing protein n=1 Tax=Alienimonas chondri TaxID=2681879 RepID=A0ABX1VB09_9PLAN|nr:hypothetical protein [Alienimonas chondri]NNJ25284.1 hypothetical protein [Alienimonas chondri]
MAASLSAVGCVDRLAAQEPAAAPVPRPAVAPPFPGSPLLENADFFLHLRVADAWNDPTLADLTPPAVRVAGDSMAGLYGLTLAEVESLTLTGPVVAYVAAGFEQLPAEAEAAQAYGRKLGEQAYAQTVGVIRLSRDFDLGAVTAPDGEPAFVKVERKGVAGSLFVGRTGTQVWSAGLYLWQPDARTVAVGKKQRILELQSNAKTPLTRPGFAGLAEGTLQLILAPRDGLSILPTDESIAVLEAGEPPPELAAALKRYDAVRRYAAGIAFTLDLKADPPTVTVTLPALHPDQPKELAELETAVSGWVSEFKTTAINTAAAGDGLPPAFGALIESVAASARQTTEDAVVKVTFTAPSDLREQLGQPIGTSREE